MEGRQRQVSKHLAAYHIHSAACVGAGKSISILAWRARSLEALYTHIHTHKTRLTTTLRAGGEGMHNQATGSARVAGKTDRARKNEGERERESERRSRSTAKRTRFRKLSPHTCVRLPVPDRGGLKNCFPGTYWSMLQKSNAERKAAPSAPATAAALSVWFCVCEKVDVRCSIFLCV